MDKVSEYLTLAWNEFVKLKQTHPDHLILFKDGIHKCQQVIMWKELQKLNPEKYPIYDK